jgi:hypothetical protein
MELRRKSHCSAALRVAPDLSDIFFGHTTWCNYDSMLRIYKHYNLQYSTPQVSSFSSYPGTVSSIDDFYMLATMSVMETTNSVLKLNVSAISPVGTVPTFIRSQVANTLASGGKHWADIFARENSGTVCFEHSFPLLLPSHSHHNRSTTINGWCSIMPNSFPVSSSKMAHFGCWSRFLASSKLTM